MVDLQRLVLEAAGYDLLAEKKVNKNIQILTKIRNLSDALIRAGM